MELQLATHRYGGRGQPDNHQSTEVEANALDLSLIHI